jgi:hypothetical protein
MQFYTRLAGFCLAAGLGTQVFGQATPDTNAPARPALTPEAEQRAREILNQSFQKPLPSRTETPADPKVAEREAARKRAEAEAQRRVEEKKRDKIVPAVTAPQPAADAGREQRERELQRIESEVEKARKRREQQQPEPTVPAPAPAPRPSTPATAPAAAEVSPPLPALAPDVEAQVRELLNQKTAEINARRTAPPSAARPPAEAPVPAPAPTPPPVTAEIPKPSPVPAPIPVPPPTVAETTPVPAPLPVPAPVPTLTAEQEAAARQLLNQKTAEMRVAPPSVRVPQPVAVTPPPAIVTPPPSAVAVPTPQPVIPAPIPTPPVVTTPPPQPAFVPTPQPTAVPAPPLQLTSEQESKALAALNQAAPQLHGAVQPATERATRPTRAEEPKPVRKEAMFGNKRPESTPAAQSPPAVRPALAGTKAQKLADLLQAYRADKITPIEYHTERAKILAEPTP